MDTVLQHFIDMASRAKDKVCVWSEYGCFTYGEVYDLSRRIAATFIRDGVKPKDIVSIELSRTHFYLPFIYGTWMVGAAFVASDESYPEERKIFIIKDSKAKLRITSHYIETLVDSALSEENFYQIDRNDISHLIYTSGSTGVPKGVIHTHWSLLGSAMRWHDFDENSKFGSIASFSFTTGLTLLLSSTACFGGTYYIVPTDLRMNMGRMAEWVAKYNITHIFLPPAMVSVFKPISERLQVILVGGEKCTNVFSDKFQMYNYYGMSETCNGVLRFAIDKNYENTPIGKPYSDAVYILDKDDKIVHEGEICVAGYIACGYLNNPEETKKAFRPNPFFAEDGWPMIFHTGDLGRREPDGNIVFLERMDWMININGQRVEPGEVASTMCLLPEISQAFVKAFTKKDGEVYLCGYYTLSAPLDEESVREFLLAQLPRYMIPACFCELETFPLTPNGKIDQKLLQKPSFEQIQAVVNKNRESKLAIELRELIEVCVEMRGFDYEADLFKLGMSSLSAIRLVASIEEKYDCNLDVLELFSGCSVQTLEEAIINNRQKDVDRKSVQKLRQEYPLSGVQLGLYAEWYKNRESDMYNIPFTQLFDKKKYPGITVEKLRASLTAVVEAHSALKCTIETVGNCQPVMCLHPKRLVEITEKHGTVDDYFTYRKSFVRPFDLTKGLYKLVIFDTAEDIRLLADFHHIMFDGTSLTIFRSELLRSLRGEDPIGERTSMFDVAKGDVECRSGKKFERSKEYFCDLLTGAAEMSFIKKDRDGEVPCKGKVKKLLSTVNRSKLKLLAKASNSGETACFLVTLAFLLGKYKQQDEACFATVYSGRNTGKLAGTIGMLAKTIPVVCRWNAAMLVNQLIKEVNSQVISSMQNEAYSFSDMSRDFGVTSDIIFVYQGIMTDDKIGDIEEIELRDIKNPLSLQVFPTNDSYILDATYDAAQYSKELITEFLESFEVCIQSMLHAKTVADLKFLSSQQLDRLNGFNQTGWVYDSSVTLVDMFEQCVAEDPKHLAVYYEGKEFSYSDVNDLSLKLAIHLSSLQIGADDFVAVLLNRNEWIVPVAFGILKAGAAYQPLDASYPIERLKYMLDDSKAKIIVTERYFSDLLKDFEGKLIYVDEISSFYDEHDLTPFLPKPKNACVLLYTSGTTGNPKGIIIEHAQIRAYYEELKELMGLSKSTRTAFYASASFDAGVQDVLTTMACGGTLYVVPEEMRLDFAAMNEYFIRNKITNAFMTTQVGRMFIQQTTCRTLRYFMVGGERLVPFMPPDSVVFYNGYGPSETICCVTAHQVTDASSIQPIGKAHKNIKLYIVDKDGARLPIGAVGELWIAGHQVSRGYLNNPDKTAEAFIPNPFDDLAGYEKVYRTGDLVRMLPLGELEFIGRDDGQVKVRGFRIELSEVEAVIRDFSEVKDAAVVVFDSEKGGKILSAYVVADEKVDISALKRYIAALKPPYMVPDFILQIEKIPRTVNQKLDFRKLPKPQQSEAPERLIMGSGSIIADKLQDILREIISTAKINYDGNLFEYGLNSLAVIVLVSEINKEFGIELEIKRLLNGCSIHSLENDIIKVLLTRNIKPTIAEHIKELKEYYPLMRNQFGVYSSWLKNPSSLNYNIPFVLKLGTVDIERAKAALEQTMAIHFALKSTIGGAPDGSICMFPHPKAKVVSEQIVASGRDVEEVMQAFIQPHNLARGVYRFSFCQFADGLTLFGDIHHVLYDGVSHAIFTADLQQALEGVELKREIVTAYDLSEHEQENRCSPDYEKAKNYYERLLSGIDGNTAIPYDYCGNDNSAGYVSWVVGKLSYNDVENFVNSIGVTQNIFHLSVMGKLLSLFTGQSEVCFTTIYNGRNISDTQHTVGMLVKTLPIICKPDENSSVKEYLKSVQKQLLSSMTNDIYSFDEISKTYNIGIDTMFVYQGMGEVGEGNAFIRDLKADIQFELSVINGQYCINLGYNQSKYSVSLMRSLAASYEELAISLLAVRATSDASAVSSDQLVAMSEFNQTDFSYDTDTTLVDLFNERVTEEPEQMAVFYEGKVLSYQEVDELANRLADYLIDLGIGPEDYVSVMLNRSEYIVPIILGILKAGAAYQPLDLSYPVQRLRFMVNDCKAKAVITEKTLSGILSDYVGQIIYFDEVSLMKVTGKVKLIRPMPQNVCVVLYTSGTTGTPKGVVIEHAQLRAFYESFHELMGLSRNTRTALHAGYGFDAGVQDILTTMACGGTLYIIPDEMRLNLRMIDEYFIRNKITNVFMTTQLGRMFAQQTKCHTLHYFIVGGEGLTPFTPPAEINFYNGYGPSETVCCVTAHRVLDDSPLQLIGCPHKNTKLYVFDKNLNRLPIGAIGELGIAGRQVSRGYLGNPNKTALAYIANPFDTKEGYERLYRTGDMVRLTSSGEYQFFGRFDSQVKIRGFRVELSEVEEIIHRFPGVIDVTVNVFKESDGSKAIAAYIVSDKPIEEGRLSAFIRAEKPGYMVPAAMIRVEKIPLTVNGKIDKRALPIPKRRAVKKGVEPADETESAFCDIFREVLGVEKVYADDDFFAIGGSSLSAAQVIIKCEAAGFDVVYKNLFTNPTPQRLAGFVRGARDADIIAPTGAEKDEYDYSCLAYNIKDNLRNIKNNGIGDVLLTGVTGFLGSHVYKALMEMTDSRVICLVRSKNEMTSEERFQMIMTYYFEDWLSEVETSRTVIIDADLEDDKIVEKLKELTFDVIINTAANVKHFAQGDELIRNNYESIKQLITLAEIRQALLVQASSLSVAGESVNGSVPLDYRFKETDLNIGQSLENRYVYSKYLAEQMIIDAISRGKINGKIIRLGNLAARGKDGEFQINPYNSGLLRYFQGIIRLECFPVDLMDVPIEFSPIDKVAEAMIMLVGTPVEFTVFHAKNCHETHYGYLISTLKERGHKIDIVEKEDFEYRYQKALAKDKDVSGYVGFIAYLNRANSTVVDLDLERQQEVVKERLSETRVKVSSDTAFTVKALYRLGFFWPLTGNDYLESMILMLDDKAFF